MFVARVRATWVISIVILGLSLPAHTRVVTAPLVSSQPLINPSSATTRSSKGVFVNANRNQDNTTVPNLTDSSYDIETVVSNYDFSAQWSVNWFFLETNLSLQNGTKTTKSVLSSDSFGSSTKNTTNTIGLRPFQLLAGIRMGKNFSLGLRSLMTLTTYKSVENFEFAQVSDYTSVSEQNDLESTFSFHGLGGTLRVFDTNLFLAASLDYVELKTKRTLHGVATEQRNGNTSTTTTDITKKDTLTAIKEIYGIGYYSRGANRSALRVEVSYEKMPPLSKEDGLTVGELYRATAEATWSIFHFGVEYSRRRGYFVDANNLVPFFFKFEHYSDEPVSEYGFFGGLQLSRGHGLGASYFESREQKSERLSFSDTSKFEIERKTKSFGVNYTYVF